MIDPNDINILNQCISQCSDRPEGLLNYFLKNTTKSYSLDDIAWLYSYTDAYMARLNRGGKNERS